MLMLISPAKKLNLNPNLDLIKNIQTLICNKPQFLHKSKYLVEILKKISASELSQLMNISADLANLNVERFNQWQLNHEQNNINIKPALFMFNGDVYEGIKASDFSIEDINYCQQNVLILSGLYGALRPLDNIYPYRLEMGTKLLHSINLPANLYNFWQTKVTSLINHYDKTIINLASDEYFKVVNTKLINNKIVKIIFEQPKNSLYKNISFLTKYARGLMVKYIIQNKINHIEHLYNFNLHGYQYEPSLSNYTKDNKNCSLVFRQYL